MTRALAAPAGRTEFDEFLYATIGEESNGMLLSVLSALARLNLDPWDEASRLARLPRESVIQFLETLIAGLPRGSSACADPQLHAKRLSALLPQSMMDRSERPNSKSPFALTVDRRGLVRYVIYYAALAALFGGAQWLMERSHTAASSATPQVAPEQH
jgi:hypothetical protein